MEIGTGCRVVGGMERRSWISMAAAACCGSCGRRRTAGTTAPREEKRPWVPLEDSWQHVMGGELTRSGKGSLRLGWGEGLSAMKWTGAPPALPFEIEWDARRIDGTDFFCGLTFPARVSGESLTLIVGGWGGSLVGISSIDDRDASENETTCHRPFEKERWYRLRLRREAERLDTWIDGEQVIGIDTTGRKLSLRPGPIDCCAPFGLATWQTTGEFRDLRWRRLEA